MQLPHMKAAVTARLCRLDTGLAACRKMCTAVERAFDAAWSAAGLERGHPLPGRAAGSGGAPAPRPHSSGNEQRAKSGAVASSRVGAFAGTSEHIKAGSAAGGRGGAPASTGNGVCGSAGSAHAAKRRAGSLRPPGAQPAPAGSAARRRMDADEASWRPGESGGDREAHRDRYRVSEAGAPGGHDAGSAVSLMQVQAQPNVF